MLIFEYKLDGAKKQYAAIEEAIRIYSSSAISACVYGWTGETSPRMTCNAIVLYLPKHILLLLP